MWKIIAALVLMVVVTVTGGAWFAYHGAPLFQAILFGFSPIIGLYLAFLAGYQLWARWICGAPFRIGDRVQVASGRHSGQAGEVKALGQGVGLFLCLEDGPEEAAEVLWHQVRRVGRAADNEFSHD